MKDHVHAEQGREPACSSVLRRLQLQFTYAGNMLIRKVAPCMIAVGSATLLQAFVVPLHCSDKRDSLTSSRTPSARSVPTFGRANVQTEIFTHTWNAERHDTLRAAAAPNNPDTGAGSDADTTRAGILGAVAKAIASAAAVAAVAGSVPSSSATDREPEITSKCFLEVRIMEPLNAANGYSSKNAYRGRLVFGVYGKACPKAAENFLRYSGADRTNGELSYSAGQMTKMEPGFVLEGGRIAGLNTITIGGEEELEYGGEVIVSPSLLENASVDLKHDRRGLLTRRKLAKGSEFGLTLGPDPELDGSHEVFGRLLQGEDVLARLEGVPVYGASSVLEEGSLMANAFKAQNRALVYIGKNVFKDERAVDRTGMLMRRVDILNCGIL